MLKQKDDQLIIYALKQLNKFVEKVWNEIADSISIMYAIAVFLLLNNDLRNLYVFFNVNSEMLYENEQFKGRNLAALVASKVNYH